MMRKDIIRIPLCDHCVKALRSLWLFAFLLYLVLSPLKKSFAQEKSLSEEITAAAEQLAAEESDPSLAEMYAEMLSDLADDPVRINSGDEKEISRLFFLSPFQVKVLADHVSSNGQVYSLPEIASVPGFDRESVVLMAPFISLRTAASDGPVFKNPRQSLLTNFIVKPGDHDENWYGSPVKSLIKYKIEAGSFSGGFTAEKDPGEKFLTGDPPLPDFFSGYLAYTGKGIIKRIVAGDYSARFGQGTGLNTGITTVFSITAPGNLSGRDEIKPYTSTDENAFLRGIAFTAGYKKAEISVFHSVSMLDATLDTSSATGQISVRTLLKTGYHNTASYMQKKDVLKEIVTGANLSVNGRNFRTGLLWTLNSFSLPLIPERNGAESLYKFEGSMNMVTSFYYNYLLSRFLFSGEISSNAGKGFALVQNISFRPSDRLSLNAIYRNYSPDYVNFHGRGPGFTYVSNERSITAGFNFEASKGLFVSAGTEIRSFPWLRYGVSSPSSFFRQEIRVKYIPSAKFILEAYYQYRKSDVESDIIRGVPGLDVEKSRSFRIQARYAATEYITLLTRVDYRTAQPAGQTGFLLLQDVILNPGKIPITIWYRYSVFNTGGFDSGIYTYENDLVNAFSIPVLYGSGTRTYLMAGWEICSFADLRVKYRIAGYSLSGVTENSDELRIQLRLRF
jgi:hypothetical protein